MTRSQLKDIFTRPGGVLEDLFQEMETFSSFLPGVKIIGAVILAVQGFLFAFFWVFLVLALMLSAVSGKAPDFLTGFLGGGAAFLSPLARVAEGLSLALRALLVLVFFALIAEFLCINLFSQNGGKIKPVFNLAAQTVFPYYAVFALALGFSGYIFSGTGLGSPRAVLSWVILMLGGMAFVAGAFLNLTAILRKVYPAGEQEQITFVAVASAGCAVAAVWKLVLWAALALPALPEDPLKAPINGLITQARGMAPAVAGSQEKAGDKAGGAAVPVSGAAMTTETGEAPAATPVLVPAKPLLGAKTAKKNSGAVETPVDTGGVSLGFGLTYRPTPEATGQVSPTAEDQPASVTQAASPAATRP